MLRCDTVTVSQGSPPPAGWYNDPEVFGMLRYWDGFQWTDHRAPGSAGSQRTTASGLADVGTLLGSTFRAIRQRPAAVGFLVLVTAVCTALLVTVADRLLSGVVFENGSWSHGAGGALARTVAAGVPVVLALVWAHLVVCDQLYHFHVRRPRSIADSLRSATSAVPRTLAWLSAVVAAVIVAVTVLALLAASGAGALVAVLVLASIPGALWAGVKLSFLLPALVVRVRGRNPVQASADVSARRFLAAAGRLVVLWLVTTAVSMALSLLTAPLADAIVSPDQGAIDRYLVFDESEGELVYMDVDGLFDAVGLDPLTFAVLSISGAVSSALWLSGLTSLFAQTHPQPMTDSTPDPLL
jgi:hypothetical protein